MRNLPEGTIGCETCKQDRTPRRGSFAEFEAAMPPEYERVGGTLYYNRAGEAITSTLGMWLHGDFDYKIVRHSHLDNDTLVSTVWLGLDHNWGQGPPFIFETMIFGEGYDDWQERYSTEDEARAGHAAAVALVEASL